MIVLAHRLRKRAATIIAALLLGPWLPAQAAQLTLDQLMAWLADAPHGVATFTEKKYISILDTPVESSGELLFVPPDRLEKRTLEPRAESLVLDGDVLTIERQGQRHVPRHGGMLTVERRRQKHVLRLQDYPEVALMIESIRATLAGDRKALERVYHLALKGGDEHWVLVLTPLDAQVGRMIARIRMDGIHDEVHTLEILQADGDRSVMNIRQTDRRAASP